MARVLRIRHLITAHFLTQLFCALVEEQHYEMSEDHAEMELVYIRSTTTRHTVSVKWAPARGCSCTVRLQRTHINLSNNSLSKYE